MPQNQNRLDRVPLHELREMLRNTEAFDPNGEAARLIGRELDRRLGVDRREVRQLKLSKHTVENQLRLVRSKLPQSEVAECYAHAMECVLRWVLSDGETLPPVSKLREIRKATGLQKQIDASNINPTAQPSLASFPAVRTCDKHESAESSSDLHECG